MITPDAPGRWRLDKTVNVALVGALVGQLCLLVWDKATTQERIKVLEKSIEALSVVPEKVAGLAATIDAVKNDTAEIKLSLRQARR